MELNELIGSGIFLFSRFKNSCRYIKRTLFLISLTALPVANAKPTLVWLKPIESDQKMVGSTIVSGSALDLMQFVAGQIDSVNHKFEAYPIKRSWHLIQNSKSEELTYCFWGADYKPEREEWGYFTGPTSVALPYMVVTRRDELSEYEQDGSISVKQLLSEGYSTVIFEKVINAWTKIVDDTKKGAVIKISGLDKDLSEHTLSMVKKNRIDFGYVSYRTIANLGLADNPDISLYKVRELINSNFSDSRILCAKTELGNKMAESIDSALEKILKNNALNRRLRELTFKAEGYPTASKKDFESQWDKFFN